jgi:Iron-containing redox enzyme
MDDSILSPRLRVAIRESNEHLHRLSPRDALATLLDVHALHLAPIDELQGAEQWQHVPRVAEVKGLLERRFRSRLDSDGPVARPSDAREVADAFRSIAHDDLVPPIYTWLATEADRADLVEFIALEGGPDADFDDLVALCQIGLTGVPKLTLGANYWDEMGRGDLEAVHTELHRHMSDRLDVRGIALDDLPVSALERKTLNGYLATNRALQPEMIGSLGLLECQAGPRCRRVVQAMRRLGVPAGALPFYEEHATADPRHGKDWIEGAVLPLVEARPHWGPRILTGAAWRVAVNRRFFAAMEEHFGLVRRAA